jgi:hypothetical protein
MGSVTLESEEVEVQKIIGNLSKTVVSDETVSKQRLVNNWTIF